ncbi:enoyl-CoA hydratase-related protein [Actinomadura sp. KC345]|uniref:enoyl-CoA hydratase-related protein n=1 Tax=Actinomadura sp. KC345 TaxID=2530371 RepID=UPI001A9D3205|nr:enoyl-CoA hydratase-related protein [Actinomadura sp. KC345]
MSDKVAVITLNRPEAANARTGALLDGLDAAWAPADEDVRVIVQKVNGRHFSAGHDLKAREGAPEKLTLEWIYSMETRWYQ